MFGFYTCTECHKLTRDTGNGEGDFHMCRDCYEITLLVQALDAGELTQAQYENELAKIADRMLKKEKK